MSYVLGHRKSMGNVELGKKTERKSMFPFEHIFG
jgi:hypothetical protein